MRNRIVNVQQVELVKLRYLRHSRGQGKVVGWILKQWVTRNFDLVIVNIGGGIDEANRLRIRDEMDLMIAAGKFKPKLGGYYTTSAIRRITSDANLHEGSRDCSIGFRDDSRGCRW